MFDNQAIILKSDIFQNLKFVPLEVKRFKKALEDNIMRYENANGEIKIKDSPNIPLNFGPAGEA